MKVAHSSTTSTDAMRPDEDPNGPVIPRIPGPRRPTSALGPRPELPESHPAPAPLPHDLNLGYGIPAAWSAFGAA